MPKVKIAPSAEELGGRSEHQQNPHLDPTDRKHVWHHAHVEHDPYPGEYPKPLYQKGGVTCEVENAIMEEAHVKAGWSVKPV